MSRSGAVPKVQRRDVWFAAASFCVVGAFLSHILAAPVIARTWPVRTQATTAIADDARVYLPGGGNKEERMRLVRTTTIAQQSSAFVPKGVTVYSVNVDVRGTDSITVARERRVVSQAVLSGAAENTPVNTEEITEFNATGDQVQSSRRIDDMTGQLLRFPKDTKAVDYDLWDANTQRAWRATYVGTRSIDGHRTFVFTQAIPETVIGHVPASDGAVGDVTIAVKRRVWVRPEIGAIVNDELRIVKRQRVGTAVVLLIDANFRDRPADVERASRAVDDAIDRARLLLVIVPAALVALGLAALIAAVLSAAGLKRTAGNSRLLRKIGLRARR